MKMTTRSTARRAMIAMTAVALLGTGMAGTASAKTAWATLTDQNSSTPTGTTYKNTYGQWIYAEVNGFDVYGNLVVQTRSYWNQQQSSVTAPASANSFQGVVTGPSTIYCVTNLNIWRGPTVACHAGGIRGSSSAGGLGPFDLGIWARGQ